VLTCVRGSRSASDECWPLVSTSRPPSSRRTRREEALPLMYTRLRRPPVVGCTICTIWIVRGAGKGSGYREGKLLYAMPAYCLGLRRNVATPHWWSRITYTQQHTGKGVEQELMRSLLHNNACYGRPCASASSTI
jgi:hypothetical protein